MLIAEIIRNASTAHEIYFLLASYIEAARYCDPSERLPTDLRRLPIDGTDDLGARVDRLKSAFAAPFDVLDENDRAIVREALVIFGCARKRLTYLAEAECEILARAA